MNTKHKVSPIFPTTVILTIILIGMNLTARYNSPLAENSRRVSYALEKMKEAEALKELQEAQDLKEMQEDFNN
jgi:hypothetical protein